jgi:hypothetical protein
MSYKFDGVIRTRRTPSINSIPGPGDLLPGYPPEWDEASYPRDEAQRDWLEYSGYTFCEDSGEWTKVLGYTQRIARKEHGPIYGSQDLKRGGAYMIRKGESYMEKRVRIIDDATGHGEVTTYRFKITDP